MLNYIVVFYLSNYICSLKAVFHFFKCQTPLEIQVRNGEILDFNKGKYVQSNIINIVLRLANNSFSFYYYTQRGLDPFFFSFCLKCRILREGCLVTRSSEK